MWKDYLSGDETVYTMQNRLDKQKREFESEIEKIRREAIKKSLDYEERIKKLNDELFDAINWRSYYETELEGLLTRIDKRDDWPIDSDLSDKVCIIFSEYETKITQLKLEIDRLFEENNYLVKEINRINKENSLVLSKLHTAINAFEVLVSGKLNFVDMYARGILETIR